MIGAGLHNDDSATFLYPGVRLFDLRPPTAFTSAEPCKDIPSNVFPASTASFKPAVRSEICWIAKLMIKSCLPSPSTSAKQEVSLRLRLLVPKSYACAEADKRGGPPFNDRAPANVTVAGLTFAASNV